jgi:anti-anti-sigma factor
VRGNTPFRIEEVVEGKGVVRLALIGELDLATKHALQRRLSDLRSRHTKVRLDLSQLEFVDASGLSALVSAIADARRNGGLELDRGLAPQVSRLLAVVGLELS